MTNYEHLMSACSKLDEPCRNRECAEAVKQEPASGRWFITMGHAGFNSPANNRSGYETREAATKAMKRYLSK